MFCQKCGAELTPGAVFCIKCGTKAPVLADFEKTEDVKSTSNVKNDINSILNSVMINSDKLTIAIISFQNGDEGAFDTIYNESKKYVYYTILKTTGDKEVADDILQETYLDVYKSLGQLKTPEAFKGWAAKIAQHKISRYYQKKSPDLFSSEEEMEDTVGELTEDDMSALPEDAMINKEVQRLISEIVDELPENQKSAIISFYYNQMSVAEIAESMDVTENAVKIYLNRGRSRIKDGVLEIEKKHGTKLYMLPLAGLLGLVFTEEAKAATVSATSAQVLGQMDRTSDSVSAENVSKPTIQETLSHGAGITGKGVKAVSTAAKAGGISGSVIRTIAICAAAGLLIGGGTTAVIFNMRSEVADSYEEEHNDKEELNDDEVLLISGKEEEDYNSDSAVPGDNEEEFDSEENDGESANSENDKATDETAVETANEKSKMKEEEEISTDTIEQTYIDAADAYLKKDQPLKAAEILTAAMMNGNYPGVYEKLKDIRRNTVDNCEHMKQYNEVTKSLMYEAWLETVYEGNKPVEKKEYVVIDGKKAPSSDYEYQPSDMVPDYNALKRDSDGRIVSVTYSDDVREEIHEYEYDDYGRILHQKVTGKNYFGKRITVYEYNYTADGYTIIGKDISEDGSDLGYESTTEERHDALGGKMEARSHWDEGEIYGGWAEWTHDYHYISTRDCNLNRVDDDVIWNDYPGDGLSEILYM